MVNPRQKQQNACWKFDRLKLEHMKCERIFILAGLIVWLVMSAVLFILSFAEFWHRVLEIVCNPPYSGKTIAALLLCSTLSLIAAILSLLRIGAKPKVLHIYQAQRKIDLCCDTPTTHDEFGYSQFVKMFASVLNGCAAKPSETHYIGLYGKWGSGKTSISLMVRRLCAEQKSRIKFVDFRPWRKSAFVSLSEELMDSLASSLTDEDDIRSIDFRLLGWKIGHSNLWSIITSLPSVGDLFKAFGGLFNDIGTIKERLDMALLSIAQKQHVVVMIDDVDRLSTGDIADLARLLKSSADFKNVTYVILADEEYVAAALSEFAPKVDNAIETGRSYLEKLVPIALHVPQISSNRLEAKAWAMINDLLSELIDGGVEILPATKDFVRPYLVNMRSVIRFYNSLKSQLYYYVDGEKRRVSIDINDFLQLAILRLFEPAFYTSIYENRSWLIETSSQMEYRLRPKYIENDLRIFLAPRVDNVKWMHLFNFLKSCLGWDEIAGVVKNSHEYRYSLELPELRDAESKFKLCSPAWFSSYFACDVDVGDAISIEEYDKLAASYPSVNQAIEVLLEFHKKGRLVKLLQGLYSRELPDRPHFVRTLLLALARIGDMALRTDNGHHSPIWYRTEQSDLHDWIVLTFCEALSKASDDVDAREVLAFEILHESAACFVLGKLIEGTHLIIRKNPERFRHMLIQNTLYAMKGDAFWYSPKLIAMYSAFKSVVLDSYEKDTIITEFQEIVKDRITEFQSMSYVLASFVSPIDRFPANTIPAYSLDFKQAKLFLDMDAVKKTLQETDNRGFLPVEWLTILVAIEEDEKTNCSVAMSGEEVFLNTYDDGSVRQRIAERAKHPELINGVLLNR